MEKILASEPTLERSFRWMLWAAGQTSIGLLLLSKN